jgi:hypothetical protein
MKKIIVSYFYGNILLPIENGQEYDYDIKIVNKIVKLAIKEKLDIMMKHSGENLIIYISDKGFYQR